MTLFQKIRFRIALKRFRKANLHLWSTLEDLRRYWIKAVEQGRDGFIDLMGEYISTALSYSINIDDLYWEDSLYAINRIHNVISEDIKDIPIISRADVLAEKREDDPWNYEGRLWYFYSHTIASAYGWTKDAIAKLSINDGLAYVQEIFTDEYQQREFVWSASDVAYSLDKRTKKPKYNALSKPYWMRPVFKEIKKAPPPEVPEHLKPVGNGIDLYEKAKEIELKRNVESL